MKAVVFSVICIIISNIFIYSQPHPIKWGKINQEEHEIDYSDYYADAVVLCDYGTLSFELNNIVRDENYSEVLSDMKSRLEKWRKRTNDTMTIRDVRKDRIRYVGENANRSTLLNLEKR